MSENNWPDPENPGVPLNPNKDRFHWVDGVPQSWGTYDGGNVWYRDGLFYRPAEWARYQYGGPCLTPAEVAQIKAERLEAREALRILVAWSRPFIENTPITAETLWREFPRAIESAREVLKKEVT